MRIQRNSLGKVFIFLLTLSFFMSCGFKPNDTKYTHRTVFLRNATEHPVHFKITHAYDSGEIYFDAIIPAETTETIPRERNAGLCKFRTINPDSNYFWRLTQESNDNSISFTARRIPDIEKKTIPVFNDLLYNVTIECKTRDGFFTEIPREIEKKAWGNVYLYESDYDKVYSFHLKDEAMYYKKNPDGTFDTTKLYPAVKRNTADTPPHWPADPNNPADADKVPLFFTISYDAGAKRIVIQK